MSRTRTYTIHCDGPDTGTWCEQGTGDYPAAVELAEYRNEAEQAARRQGWRLVVGTPGPVCDASTVVAAGALPRRSGLLVRVLVGCTRASTRGVNPFYKTMWTNQPHPDDSDKKARRTRLGDVGCSLPVRVRPVGPATEAPPPSPS